MLVSAISSNSCQTVFSTNNKAKNTDCYTDTVFNSLSPKKISDNQKKLFDSINEWKYFCHHQIEQGKLNIIA